jgi:futalosine hydrolase
LCEVEAMEGFGVLRATALAGVPAVEVRVISNSVSHADRSLWRIDDALATLRDAVPRVVSALQS